MEEFHIPVPAANFKNWFKKQVRFRLKVVTYQKCFWLSHKRQISNDKYYKPKTQHSKQHNQYKRTEWAQAS